MDDTVSYHFATVKQRRENRHEIDFQLAFRQQPKQSRMCGVGEKADRRPIDPPPIIQLRVVDPSLSPTEANTYLQNPYYFMYVSLMAADLEEEVHLLRDGKTRSTTGSVVSSLYHLKDTNNTDAGFFVFPDLSVRMEGKYRLKFSLFEIIGKEVFHCKSVLSDQFIVYSAKKFPGMEESTFLSRSFADQGLKIRIRKELRQRRKTTGKRMDSDNDDDDDESSQQARNLDKRPRQTTDSIVPSSIPSLNNLTTAPLMPISSSSVLDLRVPPSPQNMYGLQTSYGERSPAYFHPNDVDLHWAGSRPHQQQQQQSWQQSHPQQHSTTPTNQYYMNTTTVAPSDQSKRYPSEAYSDPLHQQPHSIRHYHTPLPLAPLPSTSYASYTTPSSYSHHQVPLTQQHQQHTTYGFQPPPRIQDSFQQQYTTTAESVMHQLPAKQDNLFIHKRQ